MSERNGDRARFRKNRARKLAHRQRIQALMARLRNRSKETGPEAAARASLVMNDEGSPARVGD